ncbi:hypothetical protein AAMO2058_000853700 [Amorphochlora amoebiformis]
MFPRNMNVDTRSAMEIEPRTPQSTRATEDTCARRLRVHRAAKSAKSEKHSDLHWTIPTGIEILAHVTVYSVIMTLFFFQYIGAVTEDIAQKEFVSVGQTAINTMCDQAGKINNGSLAYEDLKTQDEAANQIISRAFDFLNSTAIRGICQTRQAELVAGAVFLLPMLQQVYSESDKGFERRQNHNFELYHSWVVFDTALIACVVFVFGFATIYKNLGKKFWSEIFVRVCIIMGLVLLFDFFFFYFGINLYHISGTYEIVRAMLYGAFPTIVTLHDPKTISEPPNSNFDIVIGMIGAGFAGAFIIWGISIIIGRYRTTTNTKKLQLSAIPTEAKDFSNGGSTKTPLGNSGIQTGERSPITVV